MKQAAHGVILLLEVGLLAVVTLVPGNLFFSTKTKPADSGKNFQKFLNQFKKAELPYAFTKEAILKQLEARTEEEGEAQFIKQSTTKRLNDPDRFIPRNRMEMVSRVPTYRAPVIRLATAEHHLVVYSASRGFSRGYKNYVGVVFDKKGNYISSNRLAESGSAIMTVSAIDENLRAIVQTYKVNWKNDLLEEGIEGNTITGQTLETSNEIDLTMPSVDEDPFKRTPSKKKLTPPKALGAVFLH